MKKVSELLFAFLMCGASYADTAYGTLNNFDVVNDTGQTCYGFLIELDDIRSTDITYTYDWNHYGPPRISEDNSDPAHPKVFIWHESKKNPDGTFIAFTNPVDPANHPITPTSGHDCTNPAVNFGCEHFGVGLYKGPSVVKYNWLIANPVQPGTLAVGPAVTISAPVFVYYPPVPAPIPGDPPQPARVQAVIEPPEPPEPEPDQWGVPVYVKILKTVQPAGDHLHLDELVTDDETDPNDINWDGDEPVETEFEWTVFQKRPPGEEEVELVGEDELPEGDEMVTRRYEFYVYDGPVNPEDGEAQCDNPESPGCEGTVGDYIGSQMAGFNVEAPLGLVDNLQDGFVAVPYVDRTVVIGGNKPDLGYILAITGTLPNGLELDPLTGILSGTPTVAGTFTFTVQVTDADLIQEVNEYTMHILSPLIITTDSLPGGKEMVAYSFTVLSDGGLAPYSWSAEGLPPGLVLSLEGLISGQPDPGAAGNYPVTLTVSDARGETISGDFSLFIQAPLLITSSALPNATETTAYSEILTAEGGIPPYSWSADGLPEGLAASENGIISGQPATGTAGDYIVNIVVTDAQGEAAATTIPLGVEVLPAVRGDVDGDRDVDRNDLALVVAARNKPAIENDPRDLDGDKKITVLDARILVTLFTRPGGAVN